MILSCCQLQYATMRDGRFSEALDYHAVTGPGPSGDTCANIGDDLVRLVLH